MNRFELHAEALKRRMRAEFRYKRAPTDLAVLTELASAKTAYAQLIADIIHDLEEVESEAERHHRDFEAISTICEIWRNLEDTSVSCMRAIQNIVG